MHIHRRLSALLFFLARHRHSAAELAAAMGVSLRTVYRDIERLRKEGYAIEGVSGPGGGFWLAEGSAPAPLSLGLDEVREVLFALHGAGSLDTDLEERLLGALPAVHSTELRAALSKAEAPSAICTRTTRQERRQALAVSTRALARGQLFSFNDPTKPVQGRHRRGWPVGMVRRPEGWCLVLELLRDPQRSHLEQPLHRVIHPRVYNRRRPPPPITCRQTPQQARL